MKLLRTSTHYTVVFDKTDTQGIALRAFKTIEPALAFALSKREPFIESIDAEIYDYIKKNNHLILRQKYWLFMM